MNTNNRKLILSLILMFFVGQLSSSALAEQKETKANALLESRYIFESDIDKQNGQISISETKLSAGYEFKLNNGMPVSLSVSGKHTDIKSDAAVFLPSHLVALSLGAGVKFPAPFTASENYFVGVDIMPSVYSDDWGKVSSSTFRLPVRTYLVYRRDENFIVIAGVSIRPNFDTKILPLIGFIYRPNDSWEINIASDNPHVSYQLSNQTKLFLEADLVNDEYELTQAGHKGRVLFYREFSAGLGIKHSFTKNLSGLISAGSVFKRMLRYEDDQGKVVPDGGLYLKARIQLDF